jgi:hypothetical protein
MDHNIGSRKIPISPPKIAEKSPKLVITTLAFDRSGKKGLGQVPAFDLSPYDTTGLSGTLTGGTCGFNRMS